MLSELVRSISRDLSACEGVHSGCLAVEKAESTMGSLSSSDDDAESTSSPISPLPRTVGRNEAPVNVPMLLQRRLARGFPTKVPVIDCSLIAAEVTKRSHPSVLAGLTASIGDRYELLGALGQGTTAVVYAARRRHDDKQVALKVIRVDDEELISRAEQEFTMMRGLHHPNIVGALDFFAHSMGAVLVLEHFAGVDLEVAVQSSRKRHFDEKCSRSLFLALMKAIAYLHRRGIVHRDVKPANVLVSLALNDLRLTDFNTACSIVDGGALTMTGTIDFLPPEVLLGCSLTEASDVWAAGLCLHFMLAGEVPVRRNLFSSHADFGRATLAAFKAPLHGEAFRHLEVSSPCLESLRRCLEVDVDLRATADEVLAAEWLC